jgi:hypothetical protein
VLTHLIETQGHVGSLEPGRGILSKWKLGPNCEDLERQDREVRLDVDRALRVRDCCLSLMHVFKRVVCADY